MARIMNSPGQSHYYLGGYRAYGRYQWNVKYYGWESEDEIESARRWMLGEYIKGSFEEIDELIGHKVKAGLEGRSGGWFVIYDELNEDQLNIVDKHIRWGMKHLKEFLEEERRIVLEAEAEEEYRYIQFICDQGTD